MSSLLPLTVLVAVVVSGADPVARKPTEASVHFHDGSVLNRVLVRDDVEIVTRYGKLAVPMADVRRIEFGHRLPEDVAVKIRLAIKRLGHEEFSQREAAENDLAALGKTAYPALQIAAQSPDKETARRARALVDKVRKEVPEEDLQFRREDVVLTHDCTLSGRIVMSSLKVETQKFGEVTLKLADLKTAYSMATMSTRVAVEAAPFAATPERWFDTGITLEGGMNVVLSASGSVDLTPQLPDKQTSGPEGCERAGKTFGISAGTLLGRIGDKGELFVISKRYETKIDRAGRLEVYIVPPGENAAPIGAYQLTVTTGFGLAVNRARNQEVPNAGSGNLAGVVMINGKAGADFEICLVPVNAVFKKGTAATTDMDGTFEVVDVACGDYKVTVKGKNVPARFSDPKTTPLTFRVQKGDNIGSFDLK